MAFTRISLSAALFGAVSLVSGEEVEYNVNYTEDPLSEEDLLKGPASDAHLASSFLGLEAAVFFLSEKDLLKGPASDAHLASSFLGLEAAVFF